METWVCWSRRHKPACSIPVTAPGLQTGSFPFAGKAPDLQRAAEYAIIPLLPKWRNGRRGGFKIRCPEKRAGSSPAFGTVKEACNLNGCRLFCGCHLTCPAREARRAEHGNRGRTRENTEKFRRAVDASVNNAEQFGNLTMMMGLVFRGKDKTDSRVKY